jgi:iron(III) transport system permease protein
MADPAGSRSVRAGGTLDLVLPVVVFAILLVGILYPNVFTVVGSLFPDGTFSLATYVRFLSTPSSVEALVNSLVISIGTVFFAALIGVPLAFVFHRYDFFGRRFFRAIASAPVLLPPLVGVIAFMFLYGESGLVSRIIQELFGLDSPWPRLAGLPAILFVHSYSMYVYFFLFTGAGLERLDFAIEEASDSLGASRTTTLRRAVLPMLAPAIIGAALITFMSSMASFSAPYIFGGGIRVLSVEIFNSKLNGETPMALVETVVLASASLTVLLLLRWYEGRTRYSAIGKGVARPRAPITSRWARAAAGVAGAGVVTVLILPHLMVILMSFVEDGAWTTQLLPPTYTLENYTQLFERAQFSEPIINSLWMAGAATGANLVWGLGAVFWLRKQKGLSRKFADALIILPWALPGTVVALAMLESFSTLLAGTIVLLPTVYFIRNLPLVYRAIDASFSQMDPSVEEASATLGAGTFYTIRRVVLPLVLPGALAGSLLAFIAAFGDFVTSIMVYVYFNRPISIEILSQLRAFNYGSAAAYSVFLILVIAISLGLGERVRTARNVTLMS